MAGLVQHKAGHDDDEAFQRSRQQVIPIDDQRIAID
jgi:hypothetical protein